MSGHTEDRRNRRVNGWRIVGWGIAAFLLLLPLIAMQFAQEVHWTATDFAVAGALIGGVGVTFELAVRMTGNRLYRAAVGAALAATFLLIWVNLAVGYIGAENNPANLLFAGVLAIGLLGAVITRFQPDGMARAMIATAIVQALVGVIALIAEPVTAIPTGFFVALWLLSAWLFAKAAREHASVSAAL